MFNLCMNNQYNLDLRKQQKLFKLLSAVTTQQNNKLLPQSHAHSNHSSLQNIHDICVSVLFTFLTKSDHFSLQKTSKLFSIIGRRKDSFRIIDHRYITFGSYLQIEHKLPYIIDRLKSNNEEDWVKAAEILQSFYYSSYYNQLIKKLMHSAILPLLFNICLNCNEALCIRIITIINEWITFYSECPYYILIKYGLFRFIRGIITHSDTDVLTNAFHMILSLIETHTPTVISLNHSNMFPFIVQHMIRCKETSGNARVLQILLALISSNSFKWNDASHTIGIKQMSKHILVTWIHEIFLDNDESDESDITDDDDDDEHKHATRIYAILESKMPVIIGNENRNAALSLDYLGTTADNHSDLSDFYHVLANDNAFVSFITNELDEDPAFATQLIQNMFVHRNDEYCLFSVKKHMHSVMIRKLIKSCYCSTDTTAMKCCLAVSNDCCIEDKMVLAKYGIAYVFQDFISYFQNDEDALGGLCGVLEALESYADCCESVVLKQLRFGYRMRKRLLKNENYSKEMKRAIRKCDLIWRKFMQSEQNRIGKQKCVSETGFESDNSDCFSDTSSEGEEHNMSDDNKMNSGSI